jgi:hypothetical protein
MNEFHRQPAAYWQMPMGVQPSWPPYPYGQPFQGAGPVQPLQAQYAAAQPTPASSLFGNSRFIKGGRVGAAAAYLLSNESVQQNAIKTAVKAWSLLQGGIEEMKERFRDAEAELHAVEAADED